MDLARPQDVLGDCVVDDVTDRKALDDLVFRDTAVTVLAADRGRVPAVLLRTAIVTTLDWHLSCFNGPEQLEGELESN